ncbi:Glutamyl-tRNA(Gln) amidotransferase subunit C, mitochondrial [Dirofilaria immitis]|nr:Glutamyl-tRNA(Gln) amidotransferase subunit C, mitochondrial [Dirofilaria immitis]
MNLSLINFELILQQRFRSLGFGRRYKSNKALRNNSTTASLGDEDEEIYVPRNPTPSPIDQSKVEEPPIFDKALITHLERLSLLRFNDEQEVSNLRQAIRFANQLKLIDTTGIKPLETLLEDIPCPLREDIAGNPMTKDEVLMNAAKTVEDYFVVPLGNIPLEELDKLDLTEVEDYDRKATDKKIY